MIHTIYRDDQIIIALNGFPYVVDVDDVRYDDVIDAIEDDDEIALKELLSTKKRAGKMMHDLAERGIEERLDGYTYMGNPIPMDLTAYLRAALDRGSNFEPVVKFIERLFENPSNDTRNRLFEFMTRNQMPLAKDGKFLAYKAVRANYLDKHSGRVSNRPGTVVPRMTWSEVDTNPDITCSRGYHAASKDYLEDFFYSEGDRVVAVAIAPEDVGAIPADYNGAKLRCRQYTVLEDITDAYVETQKREEVRMGSGEIDPRFQDKDDDYYMDHDYY